MWKGKYIRMEKKQPSDNPMFPTSEADNVSQCRSALPSGYWVTGTLMNEPEVGTWLLIARDCRNGEKVPGIMNTSLIQDIHESEDGLIITTINSVYVITEQFANPESLN